MKVLIDSQGLQARIHLQDGQRLKTLLHALEQIPGCRVWFSSQATLSAALLEKYDVLVITTRKIQDNPYAAVELTAITDFVRRGGGLLLMANHGDVPGRPYPNMTLNDALLADQFGIEIENSFFASTEWGKLAEISGSDLWTAHPIISGLQSGQPVRSLVTNNCSSLLIGAGCLPLASLPGTMHDYRNSDPPRGRYFAAAAEAGKGRIVVTADSGFIGSKATVQPGLLTAESATRPGFGLIEAGDNLLLILNTLLWLRTT